MIPAAIKEHMGSMFPHGPEPVDRTFVFKAKQNGTIEFGEALRVSPEEPQHALVLNLRAHRRQCARERAERVEAGPAQLPWPHRLL